MSSPIRHGYEERGVEGYYLEHGADYVNPHVDQVRELLLRNEHRLDYSRALDFCCGGGEASLVLAALGYTVAAASDPFTGEAYRRHTGRTCLPLSFDDVIRGGLSGDFSVVIASFALHLCPPKQLYPLVWQLFQHAPCLAVITPHKRPALETLDGVALAFTDHALTERGKKVFLKAYRPDL